MLIHLINDDGITKLMTVYTVLSNKLRKFNCVQNVQAMTPPFVYMLRDIITICNCLIKKSNQKRCLEVGAVEQLLWKPVFEGCGAFDLDCYRK